MSDHVVIAERGNAASYFVFVPDGRKCWLGDEHDLLCKRCGERFPMPFGNLQFVVGVGKAFARAHRLCKPGSKP